MLVAGASPRRANTSLGPNECPSAMKLARQVERATIVRGSISGAEIIEAVPVVFMYTIRAVHGYVWTHFILWQSCVAKALQDLHQNFGDLSFFLPASNRARAHMSPGLRIKSTHPVRMALFGIPSKRAELSSCAKVSPLDRLNTFCSIGSAPREDNANGIRPLSRASEWKNASIGRWGLSTGSRLLKCNTPPPKVRLVLGAITYRRSGRVFTPSRACSTGNPALLERISTRRLACLGSRCCTNT
jgi:hypothetical protein